MNDILRGLKSNARLRVGVALIFAILWLNGILELKSRVESESEEYLRLDRKTVSLAARASQNVWLEREKESLAIRLRMESRIWRDSSAGVSQARWQDWLDEMLNAAGAEQHTIRISEAIKERVDSRRPWIPMRAQLEFDFTPERLGKILYELEVAEKLNQVDVLSVGLRGKASIHLVAWAAIDSGTSTEGGPQ